MKNEQKNFTVQAAVQIGRPAICTAPVSARAEKKNTQQKIRFFFKFFLNFKSACGFLQPFFKTKLLLF